MNWQSTKRSGTLRMMFWRSSHWSGIVTATAMICLCASVGFAQCNRGGGRSAGGLSAGQPSAQFASSLGSSFGNPFASALASQQLQSQLAQRQMLAQQYMLRQAFARQQRARANQPRNRERQAVADERAVAYRSSLRNERIRRQNAEKAYAIALKAEGNGNAQKAKESYRRVLRILGPTSSLGEKARDAIAALRDSNPPDTDSLSRTETMLASLTSTTP